MNRAVSALGAAVFAVHAMTGCASDSGRADRTDGLELQYLWRDSVEDRTAFYAVERSGTFRSAGGMKAGLREPTFRLELTDEELARLRELVAAIDAARREDEGDGEGDGGATSAVRSEISLRESGRRYEFVVSAEDAAVDRLRAYLAELSMRQYRNVLDALPEPGPRKR